MPRQGLPQRLHPVRGRLVTLRIQRDEGLAVRGPMETLSVKPRLIGWGRPMSSISDAISSPSGPGSETAHHPEVAQEHCVEALLLGLVDAPEHGGGMEGRQRLRRPARREDQATLA
jgi:hypothetical protein